VVENLIQLFDDEARHDQGYLNDSWDLDSEKIELIQVVLREPCKGRNIFERPFRPAMTVLEFKEWFVQKTQEKQHGQMNKLELDTADFKLMSNYQELQDDQTLESYAHYGNLAVVICFKLKGGGLVRKHVSKHQALQVLKTKAKAFATKGDETFDLRAFPDDFQRFVTAQKDKLEAVQLMVGEGRDIVKLALRNANDTTLMELKNMMEKKYEGKDDASESRIAIATTMLFPSLETLGASAKALASVHGEMMAYLMGCYAEKYHFFHGAEARFENKRFASDIVDEQKRRVILTDAGAPTSVEQSPNCAAM
ncbi:unnamed protein product, partial [Effrenium voratum]